MRIVVLLLGVLAGLAVLAIGIALVRFNLKRRRVIRSAAALTDDELESIYSQIERGAEDTGATGWVLARTNRTVAGSRSLIRLPDGRADFPWAGRVVMLETGTEVTFRFVEESVTETSIAGRVYRPVLVPRQRLRSGKLRSVFSPQRLLATNDALAIVVGKVLPDLPQELLSYLLCAGRESFEFEPIDQARIGTTPSWIQGPEWPACTVCGRRMTLILQIPGTLFSPAPMGTYYWFGCGEDLDSTHVINQFT